MHEFAMKLLTDLVIPVATLAFTAIGIPLAMRMLKKAGIDLSNAEEQKISTTIETLVRTAENTITGPGKGKEKFEFVMKEALSELSDTAIDLAKYNLQARIEAAHNKLIKNGILVPLDIEQTSD